MDNFASGSARPDLVALLDSLGTPRVLVLGDLILDRYTWGDVPRVSPEAPVLVMRADKRERRLGGAASVCGLLRGLGAEVTAAGVVGDDEAGRQLGELLAESGVEGGVLTEPGRVTTIKERFMGRAANRHPHQILRVDSEQKGPVGSQTSSELRNFVLERLGQHDALLVSDYNKGVCRESTLEPIVAEAREAGKLVIVDPARRNRYSIYRGADLVTPNRTEAQMVSNHKVLSVDDAYLAGVDICRRFGIERTIVTMDRDGMVLVEPGKGPRVFPTRPRRVYDITGAGDAVLSMLGICLAGGLPLEPSIELANVAAGLEVEQVGVGAIRREEIRLELGGSTGGASPKQLGDDDELCRVVENARRRGQHVVFTNGCFDLLHAGHISYLQEAARLGDLLIVGLNSDQGIRRLKGPDRPVIQQRERAAVLAALECVDYVVVFTEDTPHRLLSLIRPDVLVKGGTYAAGEVVGKEIVEAYGGRVCVTPVTLDVSTTRIVERIQDAAQPRR